MKHILLFFAILISHLSFGQQADSISGTVQSPATDSANHTKKWFIPGHAVIQFAGNIGMFAAGPGYTFFNEKLQTDLLYGIAPGNDLQKRSSILTAKFTYNPFQIEKSNRILLEPLRTGLGVSYHFGEQHHTRWPSRYPDGYYTWSSRFRLTGFIGTAANYKFKDYNTIKRIQLYAEAGTHDFDFVSFVRDSWVSAWDIISFALGTKIVF